MGAREEREIHGVDSALVDALHVYDRKVMSKIWFTSDLHLGHTKVIGYDNRPFKNIDEHNEELIKRWNNKVAPDDIIYFLGDLAFCKDSEKLKWYISRLRGSKRMVLGNHDKKGVHWYMENGFERVYDRPILLKRRFILSHRPIDEIIDDKHSYFFNIYGHVHCAPAYKTVTKNSICVCCNRWNYEPIQIEEFNNFTPPEEKPIVHSNGHVQKT